MKKRMTSIALALAMIFAMLPAFNTQAAAASETFSVEGMNSVPTISQTGTGGYALKNDGSLWAWSYGWAYAEHIEGVTGANIEGSPYNTNSDYIQVSGDFGLKANGELYGWGDSLPGNLTATSGVKLADNIAVLDENEFLYGAYISLKTDGSLIKWAYDSSENYSTRKQTAFSKTPEVLLTDVISYEVFDTSWWALKSDGTLWCSKAGAAPVVELKQVAAFSSGGQTTLLAIKTDGTLWAWGNNTYGEVGNGGKYTSSEPQYQDYGPYYRQDTPVKILDDVIYAEAGYSSFAITSDGTLYGWGYNDNNKLGFTGGNYVLDKGYMQTTCQTTPKVITSNAAAVATTSLATVVLKRDGSLWSCGTNLYGAAGLSTKTYPYLVETLTKMMDNVALPKGMVASGTQVNQPPATPTASESVAKSMRPVILFTDEQGRINRFNVDGYRIENSSTGEITDDRVMTVTTFSKDYKLLETHNFNIELPYIAGLFVGEDYNFMVFYDYNLEEKSNVEVLRVVKYSKDWVRLGHVSISGGEIRSYGMGYGGNFSYAEYNGMLYIHTAQSIYKHSDGLNHQTNLTISIRISNMVVTDASYAISNNSTGYVSHSRAQDIMVDSQGRIVTLDNGDGYPNGAYLFRYSNKAGADKYTGAGEGAIIKAWPAGVDWNTGSDTQGIVETGNGYLSAYLDSGMGTNFDWSKHPMNAYITFTPRDSFNAAATKTYAVTSFSSTTNESVYSMQLVPVNMDSGYVIVITYDRSITNSIDSGYRMYWAKYSADGSVTALTKFNTNTIAEGNVIYTDNQLLWFEYKDSTRQNLYVVEKMISSFYTFDGKNLTYHPDKSSVSDFSDVPSTHWSYASVGKAAANGLVSGVGNGKYEPERNVSNAEWATMAVNLLYKDDNGRSGSYWWSANMDIAGSQRKIFAGTAVVANGTSSWDANKVNSGINRYDMAQVIYNIAKEQGWSISDTSSASSKIADWSSIPTNYCEAVAYCFSGGFVTGVDSKGTFNGASTMTRAQAATVLCRLLDAKNGK